MMPHSLPRMSSRTVKGVRSSASQVRLSFTADRSGTADADQQAKEKQGDHSLPPKPIVGEQEGAGQAHEVQVEQQGEQRQGRDSGGPGEPENQARGEKSGQGNENQAQPAGKPFKNL